VDPEHRLAFVAGEGNQTVAVVGPTTMKIVATHPIGKSPDVLGFYPGPGRLFVSSESGDVYVYRLRGRDLTLEVHFSMPHPRTVAVDPDTHLAYFPLENIEGRPLLRIIEVAQPDSSNTMAENPATNPPLLIASWPPPSERCLRRRTVARCRTLRSDEFMMNLR
jgi:hypothetical protein